MSNTNSLHQDIFGSVKMGYVVVQSNRMDQWRLFAEKGLGLALAECTDECQAYRIDAHARRFMIEQGPAEDVVAVGWQVKDQATLDIILARMADRKIGVEPATAEQAEQRGVSAYWRVIGPKGLPLELFVDAHTSDAPLNMLTSGFVTDECGMGHVAMTSRMPVKVQRFWQELFDARLSDRIEQPMAGIMLDISFLRLNPRHHSIAIAATRGVRLDPIRTKIQHLNMEVASMDDLSAAFKRCKALGFEMAHEIGQHPNDKELSFYVITPSGFEVELGYSALCVDEASWVPTDYPAISLWGHKPENPTLLNNLALNAGNAGRGIKSLLKPEYSPI